MFGGWMRGAVLAAAVGLMAGTALADGMPPEYADPPPQQVAPPVVLAPVDLAPRPVVVAPPSVPTAVPASPPPFQVTFGESVGYFARSGFESVRRSASLYCAGHGRAAVLDSRFRIGTDWYSRFRCIPSA